MRIKNDQAGLTLVELLVTIVVASIVTLSACTMLLFGLRINNQSTKTSMGQNTVQVLMEALEDVAAEAENLVVIEEVGENGNKWKISKNGKTFFSYKENVIYSGNCDDISALPFLEGVEESYASYQHNKLLTVYVKIQSGEYENSIYCRTAVDNDAENDVGKEIINHLVNGTTLRDGISITSNSSRLEFLRILALEYGSTGEIKNRDENEEDTEEYTYYSEWYALQKGWDKTKWGKDTAWCACYVSWALSKVSGRVTNGDLPLEATVDTNQAKPSLLGYLNDVNNTSRFVAKTEQGVPPNFECGDLIFFNFDTDREADHVGVVLATEGNYIYTIEGNTAGKVAVRKYDVNDKRIMGYGVLSWK